MSMEVRFLTCAPRVLFLATTSSQNKRTFEREIDSGTQGTEKYEFRLESVKSHTSGVSLSCYNFYINQQHWIQVKSPPKLDAHSWLHSEVPMTVFLASSFHIKQLFSSRLEVALKYSSSTQARVVQGYKGKKIPKYISVWQIGFKNDPSDIFKNEGNTQQPIIVHLGILATDCICHTKSFSVFICQDKLISVLSVYNNLFLDSIGKKYNYLI